MNETAPLPTAPGDRIEGYLARVERALERWLPGSETPPSRLHEAMRYSVLGGGKRIRPLLVYAAGEALGTEVALLDAPAVAIELMHAFSLVHDDLPAMDNDDLRRGRPTTHRAFDEATAILAADALQPLAFQVLSSDPALLPFPDAQVALVRLLAEACGSEGITGGQAIDLASEGRQLDAAELEHMYRLKTGRLLRASIMAPACCPPRPATEIRHALERFSDRLGLAFQIRDDILDIEGETAVIGKQQGADIARDKATYPAMFGLEQARGRLAELLSEAMEELERFGERGEFLRSLTRMVVERRH
ncbi:MAG: polyprenyl synthetase family protein [Gammaproteobacteria bacterium]|nr:MAG: polyprenyl synthetase family protein [Gammaproteobacteria bacterium]